MTFQSGAVVNCPTTMYVDPTARHGTRVQLAEAGREAETGSCHGRADYTQTGPKKIKIK